MLNFLMGNFTLLLEKYIEILNKPSSEQSEGFNFKAAKSRLEAREKDVLLKRIKETAWTLQGNRDKQFEILSLLYKPKLEKEDLEKIRKLSTSLRLPTIKTGLKLTIPKVPNEILADISADIREVEKTFSAGCYRASVILCGRVLETCLHRKYFDATGLDILEKNPGIGLGKLIAKLDKKNVKLDPGLTQQIHLINQVRIFSVHKKKESFIPSKAQCSAIILYTMDIVGKMF